MDECSYEDSDSRSLPRRPVPGLSAATIDPRQQEVAARHGPAGQEVRAGQLRAERDARQLGRGDGASRDGRSPLQGPAWAVAGEPVRRSMPGLAHVQGAEQGAQPTAAEHLAHDLTPAQWREEARLQGSNRLPVCQKEEKKEADEPGCLSYTRCSAEAIKEKQAKIS